MVAFPRSAAISRYGEPMPASARSARPGSQYRAGDLTALEGLDAVRKRPGMYIGATDERGLLHCVAELIDNAVDEAIAGHARRITVRLNADGSVGVDDDGRGIPVDTVPGSRISGVEFVMTRLHAGAKFGGRSYGASGGLHGVGASVVNALAARLDVDVDREGRTHRVSFRRGVAGVFEGEGPQAPFTRSAGLRPSGRVGRNRTGTRIRFWPDPQIFGQHTQVDVNGLRQRLRQTSYLVPGLMLVLDDDRGPGQPSREEFCARGGLSEFLAVVAPDPGTSPVLRLLGVGDFVENVPVLEGRGHLVSRDVERHVEVEIALRWTLGEESDIRSFVNVVPTAGGGSHVTGFERAVVKVVLDRVRALRLARGEGENPVKDDVLAGLSAVIGVRVPEPQFEGQTKDVLATAPVAAIVSRVTAEGLASWFTSPPRGERQATRAVLDKVVGAARARLAARQQRDVQRRASALENSSLPAKLADCRSGDTERTELFIVEGDSALGTAKLARDSEYQALLPIRGKILNVQRASLGDMLGNAECSAILQVIGAGSGRTFDLAAVRYGKVILMSDADVDGAHIRCLLLTLIHRYLRPLLDAGRVFAAVPPLYRIELLARGGGPAEVRYAYSADEMRATLGGLEREGRRVREPIQRYKGLGEMDARQLRETTMSPATRTLRRITPLDAAAMAEAFDLLMGAQVAPRREFLVSAATTLTRDRIDA